MPNESPLDLVSKLGLATIAISLAACGGGGSSGPIPSPTAKAASKVVFTIAGAPKSTLVAAARRRTLATCTTFSPQQLTAQASSDYNPQSGSGTFALMAEGLEATEYDASCNVVSTAPTYTQTANLTQTDPFSFTFGAPTAPEVYFYGTTPGAATITATFPDGTTGTTSAGSYATLALSCEAGSLTSGRVSYSASGNTANPDIVVAVAPGDANSYCGGNTSEPFVQTPTTLADGSTFSGNGLIFPYGYEVVSSSNSYVLAQYLNVGTFTAGGYAMTYAQLGALPNAMILVKTSTGDYLKFGLLNAGSGTAANSLAIGLISAVSSSGTFAY